MRMDGDEPHADAPAPNGLIGWLVERISRRLFRHVRIEGGAAEYVRQLATRSSLVYVVRYRSLFDYLLVSTVLAHAGLPRPVFAPDLPTLWLRPLSRILAAARRRILPQSIGAEGRSKVAHRERCRRLVEQGRPIVIFMRSRVGGIGALTRAPETLGRARAGTEFLREIVIGQWSEPRRVSFVPLAIVRGRGYRRRESRLAAVVYTVRQAPGELRRLVSFLWNRRDTTLVIGRDVQLQELIERHRSEGAERIVRRLSRALQIFLYREERMVQGPTLLSKSEVRTIVLADPALKRYVERYAWAMRKPEASVWKLAGRHFDGMAANYQGVYVSILDVVLTRVWRRIFSELRWVGLERVAERLKQHPIVLVPCHRSHLDYLILSYVFHRNFLSPPHIAAGDNLRFWPLGAIFRGAGAFFIRRSFGDDELYKLVFRSYLGFLIREGYTQEFFIEGGRSRTGKLLTPKLGMLSAVVDVFLGGNRRDLFLVPVSIQYSRIVEEQAYHRELEGGAKEKESLGALLRARRLLAQKYGDVQVTFAEPISLRESLAELHGEASGAGATAGDDSGDARRAFVEGLAQRILHDINAASVVTDTSIAAAVLLGAGAKALRYRQFLERATSLVEVLRVCGAPVADATDFGATRRFIENAGLVRRLAEVPDVIEVPDENRRSLDFYKNNSLHWFLVPSLVAHLVVQRCASENIEAEVKEWLDLYRLEFPVMPAAQVSEAVAVIRRHYRQVGLLDAVAGGDESHPLLIVLRGMLDSFHEPYWIVADVLQRLERQGASARTVQDRIAKRYRAAFLLGEVALPEGESVITIANALERYRMAECTIVTTMPGRLRSRERWITPGPESDRLITWAQRLAAVRIAGNCR